MIHNYLNVRKRTEEIVQPLEIEDFTVQPIKDVSPPKWHLGHTTWFFETFILKEFKKNYKFYSIKFQEIFNSYYKSVGPHWVQADRGILSRPTVRQIIDFRHQIDEYMIEFLNTNNDPQVDKILTVGLEHEKQHQELLLMDIKYIFASNSIEIAYSDTDLLNELPNVVLEYIPIAGGLIEVGANENAFSYDNEKPRHTVFVGPFKLANRPVTNGEYLSFINDGGYDNPTFWLSDGWECKVVNIWQAPLYWKKIDDEWYEFTFKGWEKLNLKKPVTHISFYEADAFALWSGKRLPTEFEWECSTNMYNHAENLWEWTSSSYLPYPKYQREKGPFGEYNGKFMCGQKVLKGGSFGTPKNHIRASYRNFYHPEKRWQFSGLRLAENF
ncbi:MAG: ergothioneine biosynthesis protein EgtB [Epsilonproteobacteria bacterium]|nr:MAG: ergothioneine biosynthesis protein EgtB [Campylobacterota bacterium]RLA68089.1 MAG: ergothioneine biosynthesis protein EgtB [Campylobacterota bacterium]